MAVTRPWPKAPDGAVHLIGDTHFGSTEWSGGGGRRKRIFAADLRAANRMLPESVVHVLVGDVTHTGSSDEDAEAVEFLDDVFGAGSWIAAVGNHDMYGELGGPDRSPDTAAAAWGMPAGNYVHDLGWARIVALAPEGHIGDGYTMQPFTSDRLNWLDAQLTAAGDTPCLMVCHWSLYDTVQAGYASPGTTSPGWYAYEDADIREVLAEHSNAAAWLSGHTHSTLELEGIVSAVPMGGHTLCAVNASSPAYNADGSGRSQMPTMYLTVTDGQIDVRFRDHGAGTWTAAGPDRLPTWSVPITEFTPATGYGTSPYGTSPYGG